MNCPKCNANIDNNSKFCPICGTTITEAPTFSETSVLYATTVLDDAAKAAGQAYQPPVQPQPVQQQYGAQTQQQYGSQTQQQYGAPAPQYQQPVYGQQYAPATTAVKDPAKKKKIIIIAAVAAVIVAAAIVAILLLTGGGAKKSELVGTWVMEQYGYSITYNGDGTGEVEGTKFTYKVDGSNTLTMTNVPENEDDTVSTLTYKYGKEAKDDGNENYWYIENGVFYFLGMEFTKK